MVLYSGALGCPASLEQDARLFDLAAAAAKLECDGLAVGTQKNYANALRNLTDVHPGLLPMDSIQKIKIAFTAFAGSHWSKIETLRSAVAAYHRDYGLPMPEFDSPYLARYWRGLRKSCINVVKGKEPISKAQFETLVRYWWSKGTPAGFRNAIVACLQFYLMRRVSEVLNMQRSQVTDLGVGKGLVFEILRQKNDPFGRGMKVPLPESTKDGMPLGQMLRYYMSLVPHWCPLVASTRGKYFAATQFTRDAWNRAIREALEACFPGIDRTGISSHSFRKGGCTRALQVDMPQDCMIDVAGWNSAESWMAYGKRPLEERQAFIALM
jgi:hypothetical protein